MVIFRNIVLRLLTHVIQIWLHHFRCSRGPRLARYRIGGIGFVYPFGEFETRQFPGTLFRDQNWRGTYVPVYHLAWIVQERKCFCDLRMDKKNGQYLSHMSLEGDGNQSTGIRACNIFLYHCIIAFNRFRAFNLKCRNLPNSYALFREH